MALTVASGSKTVDCRRTVRVTSRAIPAQIIAVPQLSGYIMQILRVRMWWLLNSSFSLYGLVGA